MTGAGETTGPARRSPIRVLVVDDSSFMRHAVGRLLAEAGDIEVVGTAGDGVAGLAAAIALRPDVITLDVEMPRLDGLAMLRRLMVEVPTRTVMLSSLTHDGAAVTLDALEAGAIDFVAKPGGSLSIDLGQIADELIAKVRTAAAVSDLAFGALRLRAAAQNRAGRPGDRPGSERAAATEDGGSLLPLVRPPRGPADRVVVVAASTGGPAALEALVRGLPPRLGASLLVVQHLPPGFTASLAERLAAAGSLPAREARGGDVLAMDEILVAPGGRHIVGTPRGRLELAELPPFHGVRPSADVTLVSLAPIWRERLLAVILTGMGRDGCDGARAVIEHGGEVIAQDEATSTVYGMPGAVAEVGLATAILPLPTISTAIADWAGRAGGRTRRTAGARSG